jgi:hypothetical protein
MSSRDRTATTVHDGTGRTNTQENVMGTARTIQTTAVVEELSTRRLTNVMRFGYAWP